MYKKARIPLHNGQSAQAAKWRDFYENDGYTNLPLVEKMLRELRAYIRLVGDGSDQDQWSRRYAMDEKDSRVMLLSNTHPAPGDGAMTDRLRTAVEREHMIRIDEGKSLGQISRDMCGQFAEHLGRCVYDGLGVGPDSPIPNLHGLRRDVIDVLKALRIPVLRWPGGVLRMIIIGKTGSGQ